MPVFAPFAPTYTREPTRPSGGAQPGARELMEWTVESWDQADGIDDPDPSNLGIYNPRDICGNPWPRWTCVGSQHARGAAIDVAFPNIGEGGHPEGWKYARWLVANAGILGTQEVIYARKRWDNQIRRWRTYKGPSPHLDHVHAALNASGARYLTRARILSVAPTTEEPFMPELSPDEQRRLLTNTDQIVGALRTLPKVAVVRRKGGTAVFLACGPFRVKIAPNASEPVVAQFRFALGQATVQSLPTEMFDALADIPQGAAP